MEENHLLSIQNLSDKMVALIGLTWHTFFKPAVKYFANMYMIFDIIDSNHLQKLKTFSKLKESLSFEKLKKF